MGCTVTSSLGTRTQSTASCRSPTMSSSLVARTAMSGPCISSRTGDCFLSFFEDFFNRDRFFKWYYDFHSYFFVFKKSKNKKAENRKSKNQKAENRKIQKSKKGKSIIFKTCIFQNSKKIIFFFKLYVNGMWIKNVHRVSVEYNSAGA